MTFRVGNIDAVIIGGYPRIRGNIMVPIGSTASQVEAGYFALVGGGEDPAIGHYGVGVDVDHALNGEGAVWLGDGFSPDFMAVSQRQFLYLAIGIANDYG